MPSSQAGSRIRLRRQQLDLSQAELAERVGVHESTVTAWESGKHFPSRHQGKIEVVLGLEMGSLAGSAPAAFVPADDDEARIWAMNEPEEFRRKLIDWKRRSEARAHERHARAVS